MEITFDQRELFPVIATAVKKRSFVVQLLDAAEEHGPLFTQAMVARALELSRQRVGKLVDDRSLESVNVAGHRLIPAAALNLFLTRERKVGRPLLRKVLKNIR